MTTAMPTFYDPSKIGTMFKPDLAAAVEAGRKYAKDHNIPAAALDRSGQNILTLIDMQVDFINPPNSNYPGSLAVPGAVDDVRRVCEFIIRNVGHIDHIVASLDTHHLFQPFHPYNWEAGSRPAAGYVEGDNPRPFTIITLQDVQNNVWRPTRMPKRAREMLHRLETEGKKNLCIWPLHCERGVPGQALDPMLMMVIHFHAACRNVQYTLTPKGMSPSSEHYGILWAEVQFSDDESTQLNTPIVGRWDRADRIYFAGEARTHCVQATLDQVASMYMQRSPELLQKLFVLDDCMSNVPDVVVNGQVVAPFNAITTARFAELAKMGFNFIKSTDPVPA